MRSRRKVSAPPDKIYKPSTPLQQIRFPERTTNIKSYGKQRILRVPKQETLTQMDFVASTSLVNEDENKPNSYDVGGEHEENKARRKRRKTAGDEPSATPQYHSQTITQLDWSFCSAPDEEGNGVMVDVSKISKSKARIKLEGKQGETKENQPLSRVPSSTMGPPHTPKRAMLREIPSSQSPATPQSLPLVFTPTVGPPVKHHSAVSSISFNPSSTKQLCASKPLKLVIQDTFESTTEESQQTCASSTPAKKSAPTKGVRFALHKTEDGSPKSPSFRRKQARSPQTPKAAIYRPSTERLEIMDSDADSDDLEDEPMVGHDGEKVSVPSQNLMKHLGHETCYGEIGRDTQIQVGNMLDSGGELSSSHETKGVFVVSPHPSYQHHVEASQQPCAKYDKSQVLESQRISTQVIDAMPSRTTNSDVFISIYPQHVTHIVSRTKDHEFRGWRMPSTVSRVWIYETKPVGMLKYMATIGPPKRPGEVADEKGIGNAEFNKNTSRPHYAYEILELYELANPLTLEQMIASEWMKGAVQKYAWVRPAVLDQLMANLKPPLFTQNFKGRSTPTPPSSSTDTQEAEQQLLHTIRQFTQLAPSSQIDSAQPLDKAHDQAELEPVSSDTEVIPSSQNEALTKAPQQPPLSQATTVDLSQIQLQTPRKSIPEVVWESPTRPIFSSQSMELPAPCSGEAQLGDSSVPYARASSQLLTKSQMFPESLLNESIPSPPLFIEDSDRE